MDRTEIIDRADQAKRLMENADFIAISEAVKADLYNQFCRTNILNTTAREELHKITYALELMHNKINNYIAAQTLMNAQDENT